MIRHFFHTILLLIWQCASLSAMAATGETFSPFVSASATHDSNLLRLDKSAGSTADNINQIAAGMNVDWKVARQHIVLMAAINDNRFDRYSTLNYQGRDFQARLDWELANQLSGDLGYTNNRAIGSYADQQSLIRNLRTQKRRFVDGRWLFHPDWQVGLGASKSNLSYADVVQNSLDRDDDVWEATMQYLNRANSRVGIKLRETKGNFPSQTINFVSVLDDGYRQREVLATVDWDYSGHSQLQGQAGTVWRKHNHFSSRDYTDTNARGTYVWLPTAKIKLDISALREVTAYDDLNANYSLNRGMSLGASWTPTSKITISAKSQYEKRDFIGNPGALVVTANRKDTFIAHKLSVVYQATHSFSVNASVSDERRGSNQQPFTFDSGTASISIIFQM